MTMKNPRWWFLRAVVVPLTRLPSQKTLVVRRMRKPKSFSPQTSSPRSLLVEELGTGVRRRGYAEPVRAKGFVFMDTLGYDPVSATSQVAGGANILCFTTGPRLGLWLPADSFHKGCNEFRDVPSDNGGYINRGDILDGVAVEEGAGAFRSDAARCFG
jgi:D-galactarate/Altronate dehydratase, C-terminal